MIRNQVNEDKKYMCPVCGYSGLQETPYNTYGHGSYEICVCCGFQFGYDDFPDKEQGFDNWRKKWRKDGYPWFSKRTPPPLNWNPVEQGCVDPFSIGSLL